MYLMMMMMMKRKQEKTNMKMINRISVRENEEGDEVKYRKKKETEKRRRRRTEAIERTAQEREGGREREREREKWGHGCQAFEVLRALTEIYFRPEDGAIMFLRNACYIHTQTTELPDGMSACGRVCSVGVQPDGGAAVGLTGLGLGVYD
jgi:actin-related protein